MRVVTVAQMRELERLTFEAGTDEAELQQRAGLAVAGAVSRSGEDRPHTVVALVGPGNNGRDAWIAAEALARDGWEASLYLTPRHALTEAELRGFVQTGGRLLWHTEQHPALAVQSALAGASVAIDGLLGIGGRGALRAPLHEVAAALNDARHADRKLFVVAVDTPSGLDADSGEVAGTAVRADLTVILGGAKQGLLSAAAAPYTGLLVFADIGVVDAFPDLPEVVDAPFAATMLPESGPAVHKGSFGRLLVVAGSERYLGAAYLVSAAASRSGAGIVTLAAPRWLRDVVANRLAEATYLPLPDSGPAGAAAQCADLIAAELPHFSAVALGPGLSTDGEVPALVEEVIRAAARLEKPIVVDADGLNVLARQPAWPTWVEGRVVLTPHIGELRRLAPDEELATPRPWEVAQPLAAQWGVTLLIKGPCTAIASGGRALVHTRPNPALATAGTGDVLTGIIGGLLARGLPPLEAAALGTWIHGEAGARAAVGVRAGGLLASDLLSHIPSALALAAAQPPTS